MTDLCDLRGQDLARMFSAGEATPTEALESCLRRVEAVDDRVKAFLDVTADLGRQQAREVDERLKAGEPVGPIAGVPLALKDVLCTRGITTTCGSRILHNYVPPYDCTPWERLKAGGSVLVGKTNCDEFAMGSSTENSSFFPTRNPWDLDTVPGGSSGGSAAAVAAGEAVWALGTDTGGSVRQPAALCGVVGFKPTYGLISRYGLIAFASSLDTVGTFTRDVRDCATLLSAIAGLDTMDATCLPEEPRDFTEGLDGGVEGLRVGVVRDWLGEGLEPEVRRAVGEAIDRLEGLGARVEEVAVPHAEFALSAYYILAPAECSSNLARYDGVRYGHRAADPIDAVDMNMRTRGEGFGAEVKRRVMLGTYALSAGYYEAYYGQAQKVRTLVIRDFEAAFDRVDLLVSPTSPTTAFPLGAKVDDPLAMYLNDIFTIPANLAGIPAVSLPCGLDGDGRPVGLQIMGPALDESTVLRAAHAFEQDLGLDAVPALVREAAA
jgi:aspartyl-tRNA(Asn)/glutamyl-tRNA(Gln) amidotransferase subunit A